MSKVLVVVGSDHHSYRLLSALETMPDAVIHANPFTKNRESDSELNQPSRIARQKYVDDKFLNHHYDIAFVDSTYEGDLGGLKCDVLFLFDCADKPSYPLWEGKQGRAYHDLKDKAKAYAKFSYYKSAVYHDGLQRIAFPISPYLALNQVAVAPASDWVNFNSIPHLYGTPTYIHGYDGPLTGKYTSIHEDGQKLFNQRFKWLSELEDNNIPFDAGIVFEKDGPLSAEYQEKHFPGITRFSRDREQYGQSLSKLLFQHKVGLCPAGHERNSWRLFDLMATGAIIYRTDTDIRFLYEPRHQWLVKDDDHLGDIYLRDIKNFKDMYRASQENRKVLSSLTPEKIWKDFINQID
jgi:hypothetical protein